MITIMCLKHIYLYYNYVQSIYSNTVQCASILIMFSLFIVTLLVYVFSLFIATILCYIIVHVQYIINYNYMFSLFIY